MKTVLIMVFLFLVGVIGVKLSFAYADKLTIQSSIQSVNEQKKLTEYSQALVKDMFIGEIKKNGINYLEPENMDVELDAENNEVIVSVRYTYQLSFFGKFFLSLPMSVGKLYLKD